MAITINFEINNRANSSGHYVVMLRLTQDRKLKRIKTSIQLKSKSDWNAKKQLVRSSEPNYEVWNSNLQDLKEAYRKNAEALKSAGRYTIECLMANVQSSEKTSSFLTYADDRIKELKTSGNYHNYKKYNNFYNKLTDFLKNDCKKDDLLFSELTPALLNKFDTYLHTLHNDRQPDRLLHQNTIQVAFKVFKALVNRAIKDNKGYLTIDENPFKVFSFSGIKTCKEKLYKSEIQAIKSLDLKEGSLIWHCRNYFLFSLYCAGIRCADFCCLKWCNVIENGNRLKYVMQKNNKERDLPLIDAAKAILEHYIRPEAKPSDYIFPLLNNDAEFVKTEFNVMPADKKKMLFDAIGAKNALINKELKKIGKLAGIEKNISFHISRHSFANMAKEKGVDARIIQSLLAHSELSTTERYMGSFDTDSNDKALRDVFDNSSDVASDTDALLQQLKSLDATSLADLLNKLQSSNK